MATLVFYIFEVVEARGLGLRPAFFSLKDWGVPDFCQLVLFSTPQRIEQLRPQLAGLKGGRWERLTALRSEFTERVDSFDVVPTCGGVCFVMFGHLDVTGASARCCLYP